MEFIIHEFNWTTFFIALGFFALVSSLFNFVVSYLRVLRARKRVMEADLMLAKLQSQMAAKEEELDRILKRRGKEK